MHFTHNYVRSLMCTRDKCIQSSGEIIKVVMLLTNWPMKASTKCHIGLVYASTCPPAAPPARGRLARAAPLVRRRGVWTTHATSANIATGGLVVCYRRRRDRPTDILSAILLDKFTRNTDTLFLYTSTIFEIKIKQLIELKHRNYLWYWNHRCCV